MPIELLIAALTLIISGMIAWATTSFLIVVAPRIGAVDLPGPRKVHRSPVPRVGGVAVFFGFFSGLLFAAHATGKLYTQHVDVYWSVLAICAAAMFSMGLVDDLRGLSFKTKFAVQVMAAVGIWLAGFRIEILSHPLGGGAVELGVLSLPLTVFWVVGITNALNLIDGLDGLAAGIALIVTSAVAVIALHGQHEGVVAAGIALFGSLLGFLVFNFNPAKIFLGDSGSMFLGFILAVISIRGSQKGTTAVAVLVPLLILGLPIVDTSLAIVRRLIRIVVQAPDSDRPVAYVVSNVHRVFLPDRGHIHHMLLDIGVGHRAAVLVLYGAGVVLALAAMVLVVMNSVFLAVLLVGILALSLLILITLVLTRRRRPLNRLSLESGSTPSPRPAGSLKS